MATLNNDKDRGDPMENSAELGLHGGKILNWVMKTMVMWKVKMTIKQSYVVKVKRCCGIKRQK